MSYKRINLLKFMIIMSIYILIMFVVNTPYKIKREGYIPGYTHSVEPIFSGWNDNRFKKTNESNLQFIKRVNMTIYNAYYHCNYLEYFNVIEFFASKISKTYNEVGFLKPNRHCGFCHQSSYILANVLKNNNINAKPLGINGHVVVLLELNAEYFILDPDSGGIGPFLYTDNMWDEIKSQYPEKLRNYPIAYDIYKAAYSQKNDDIPYYSLEWLNNAEQEQNKSIILAQLILSIFYFFVVILFILSRYIINIYKIKY